MNNFTFYTPTKVIFGENTIPQIGNELKKNDVKSVLLLAGSGSIKENGVYDATVKSLKENNISFVELFGVRPNPTVEHAREGKDLIAKNNLQAILAVGGGSVIDEAKALAAGYFLDDIWNAFVQKEVPQKALPIYTILTLSGTGTEANMNSVLSNDALMLKRAMYCEHTFPKVSIIDPTVQMSLPWEQTVNGGIDAITHCMENYFVGKQQETTIAISEALMNTIIKCIDGLQKDPNCYLCRANLAWASTCALNGLTAAGMGGGDWATHRMQHAISALYPEVAHGAGLAALFPSWIRYCNENNKPQFERWAKNVWNANSVEEGIENMVRKFKQWGSPTSISDLKIVPKESLPAIVDTCEKISFQLGSVRIIKREDYAKIYEMAW
jgi:alcohol dehydrogenase YqhD (iron-dependent ADH family)